MYSIKPPKFDNTSTLAQAWNRSLNIYKLSLKLRMRIVQVWNLTTFVLKEELFQGLTLSIFLMYFLWPWDSHNWDFHVFLWFQIKFSSVHHWNARYWNARYWKWLINLIKVLKRGFWCLKDISSFWCLSLIEEKRIDVERLESVQIASIEWIQSQTLKYSRNLL